MARFQVYWEKGKKGFTPLDQAAESILKNYRAVMIGLAGNPGPGDVIEKALSRGLMASEQLAELMVADWASGMTADPKEQPNLGMLTRIIRDAIEAGLRVGEERGLATTRAARRRVEQSRLNPLRPV